MFPCGNCQACYGFSVWRSTLRKSCIFQVVSGMSKPSKRNTGPCPGTGATADSVLEIPDPWLERHLLKTSLLIKTASEVGQSTISRGIA